MDGPISKGQSTPKSRDTAPRGPIRSIALARLLKFLAVVVFLTTFVGVPILFPDSSLKAFGFLAILLGVFVAFALERAARRARILKDAHAVMGADPRPPVLYLRSFADEGKKSSRYENMLKDFFSGIGPVVGLGNPNEILQSEGADRLYVGDDWQQTVTGLMRKARLVILQAGLTEGLLWEVAALVKHVNPQRLVIVLRIGDDPWNKGKLLWTKKNLRREYQKFRAFVGPHFPKSLPTHIDRGLSLRLGGVFEPHIFARHIGFGPDWEAQVLSIKNAGVWTRLRILFGNNNPKLVLAESLRPVLARIGTSTPPVPLSVLEFMHILLFFLAYSLLVVTLVAILVALVHVVLVS